MKKNMLILILGSLSLLLLVLLFKPASMTQTQEDEKEDFTAPKTATKLDLSAQGLQKLPEYVVSQTNLEELDISSNNISGALPAEIRHLQNLKILNASNNQMTGVPAEVGQLRNLEVLDLSNNQLTGLPYELGNLKNLKVLDLSGNNYAEQDLETIKEALPASTQIVL